MPPAKKKARCDKIEESVMISEDPSSGYIRFETNVSDITAAGIFSPAIEVHDLPWKLLVKKRGRPSHLAVYLEHRKTDCDIWSVDVSAELCVINSDNPTKNYVDNILSTYDHAHSAWGTHKLIDWESLVDENKGVIKDGKITIECKFALFNFVGIRTKSLIDFSDPNEPSHDIALVMEGGMVYVNKGTLAVQSPVFNGQFVEKDKKEIEMKDIVRKEFIDMLNLIYPSYEKITDAKVDSLLNLADRFQIEKITDEVEQYIINSSAYNICAKLKLSDEYRLVKLQDHCLNSLKTVKDITDLKNAVGYNDLSRNILATLMKKVMKLS